MCFGIEPKPNRTGRLERHRDTQGGETEMERVSVNKEALERKQNESLYWKCVTERTEKKEKRREREKKKGRQGVKVKWRLAGITRKAKEADERSEKKFCCITSARLQRCFAFHFVSAAFFPPFSFFFLKCHGTNDSVQGF